MPSGTVICSVTGSCALFIGSGTGIVLAVPLFAAVAGCLDSVAAAVKVAEADNLNSSLSLGLDDTKHRTAKSAGSRCFILPRGETPLRNVAHDFRKWRITGN